jgi:hypothetical protein
MQCSGKDKKKKCGFETGSHTKEGACHGGNQEAFHVGDVASELQASMAKRDAQLSSAQTTQKDGTTKKTDARADQDENDFTLTGAPGWRTRLRDSANIILDQSQETWSRTPWKDIGWGTWLGYMELGLDEYHYEHSPNWQIDFIVNVGFAMHGADAGVEGGEIAGAFAGFSLIAKIERAGAAAGRAGEMTYEIMDGVRRAKAAEIAGHEMIRAELYGPGGKIIDVPIKSLLSPKATIDTTLSPAELPRWLNTLRQTLSGSKPPPIQIQPGSVGTLIPKVDVIY